MEGDRISRAIARIAAAAHRLEGVAARPAGDPALERRYQALREETTRAMAEIERLIGALEE